MVIFSKEWRYSLPKAMETCLDQCGTYCKEAPYLSNNLRDIIVQTKPTTLEDLNRHLNQ